MINRKMAYISASKSRQFTPKILSRSSHPFRLESLYFCSSSSPEPPSDNTAPATEQNAILNPEAPVATLASAAEVPNGEKTMNRTRKTIPKGTYQTPQKTEDIICRMMANRAWTTRLQNSIRNLVPEFDHSLVYNVLHGARKPDHALQFFRWVERSKLFKHDREIHHKIIEILGRASMLNHARCILFDMPKKGVVVDEDMFVLMIDSYGKAEIVQESVKMFQKMEEFGVSRTIKSYDTLFKVILRRGRYMMAKRYFNKMLNEGIVPTVNTYNIMIWGFFLSGKVKTANRFFEEMKAKDISPNAVTYNTMINGYNRVKKMEESEKYFVEMKGKNIEPNVITYTTLIKGYISVSQVEDGLRLFKEMKSFGIKPNDVTYSTILPGLCEAEKMSEARDILLEMAGKRIAPKDNSVFKKLILGQCKTGDLDAATDVLKAMSRLNVSADAGHYSVLIEHFCKAALHDRAVKLLDVLIEKELVLNPQGDLQMDPSSYNLMIEYLCKNGLTQKAETFFRQLMKMGVQDSVAFNNLIRGHSKEGTPDSAFDLSKIMVRRNIPTDSTAYVSLIESFLKKNEPADAKAALDSMIENGHQPNSAIYRSVMSALFEDGRVQTASRVMKSMLEKGVKDHMDLVVQILKALLMRGHVEEAIGRIELLMENECKPDMDDLLCALCEKGKTIAALKLLDFVLERNLDVEFSSQEKVLDALLAAGKTLNAYSIFFKIMEKGGVRDWSNCEDLIKSLNAEGNTRQADILLKMMRGKDKDSGSRKGKKRTAMGL